MAGRGQVQDHAYTYGTHVDRANEYRRLVAQEARRMFQGNATLLSPDAFIDAHFRDVDMQDPDDDNNPSVYIKNVQDENSKIQNNLETINAEEGRGRCEFGGTSASRTTPATQAPNDQDRSHDRIRSENKSKIPEEYLREFHSFEDDGFSDKDKLSHKLVSASSKYLTCHTITHG
jgi:hypothetical protein